MRSLRIVLLALWLAALAFGGIGVVERLTSGHKLAAYTSYVPWGLWVSAYIYFIGLSAGAFLLSSLVYVFRVRALERIAKLALATAVVTLCMALLSIWFDIGQMPRFYEIFTRPNFHSMMAWMVWLYSAYFLVLLAELYLANKADLTSLRGRGGLAGLIARTFGYAHTPTDQQIARDHRWLRVLGTIGVPLAIAFHGGVGALFGTVGAREYWHSPIFPILFLTGALTSGGALIAGLVAFTWAERDQPWRDLVTLLGRIVLGLVLFDLLLEWAEYSIPMWYGVGSEFELLRYVLFGPQWYVFWLVRIGLGVAVPIVLLALWPRSRSAVGTAGFLVAGSFFAVRLNMVIPGLITPQLRGLERSFVDPRLTFGYMPSVFEWQVTLFIAALGIGLLYLAYRYLPLLTDAVSLKEEAA
ncbi:MAG: polysulfide reductase NrfD [Chloroflexi bacterium]|nr:polysulfide reductase NrfD [Chloroflexota bacterium]